jgi:hypothetical protein
LIGCDFRAANAVSSDFVLAIVMGFSISCDCTN